MILYKDFSMNNNFKYALLFALSTFRLQAADITPGHPTNIHIPNAPVKKKSSQFINIYDSDLERTSIESGLYYSDDDDLTVSSQSSAKKARISQAINESQSSSNSSLYLSSPSDATMSTPYSIGSVEGLSPISPRSSHSTISKSDEQTFLDISSPDTSVSLVLMVPGAPVRTTPPTNLETDLLAGTILNLFS